MNALDELALRVESREQQLEVLEQLPEQRKVLIHINNTNPILDEDSAERAELARRNVEVAFDGMSIEL